MERAFQVIVIGIEEYDDPSWKTLKGVSQIAARVAKALGGEPFPLPNSGGKREAPYALEDAISRIPERATLFVHWIGHGVSSADQHYLIWRDSPPLGHLNAYQALPSGELGLILANSKAERVVVVLDTCYSGKGADDLFQRYQKPLALQLPRAGWERVVCVIAASHPLDKAVAGLFSEGLADAIENPEKHLKWSKGDEYIVPEDLVQAVVDLLGKSGKEINIDPVRRGYVKAIIPNPLYEPEAGNADIETTRRLEGVFGQEAHFNLASRGIETGEAGYFFSGRRGSQEQIISWLNGRHASLMVVTGPPGSGKSALLGRIATLSVPEVRADVEKAGGLAKEDPVPPDNAVDVAVHAKGKNVFQVATTLGHSVGLDRQIVDQLGITDVVSAIEQTSERRTVIIDALDEAGCEQAQRIANEIIRPLANLPNVRLLVGTRRSLDGGLIPEGEPKHGRLVKAFGTGADILDLENEPETQADIAEFVAKRLRGVAEDKRGSDPWIEAAAAKVAAAADGSFLYARLVARSLQAAPNVQLGSMPADASAAFVQDIAARFPDDQKRVSDMLRALAFGLGLGLSRAVWAPVATALDNAGDTYDDDDIIWMLRHVGSYIVETTVATDGIGQAVYRLIHQALADHLQSGFTLGQTRIVESLSRGLEGDAWLGADHYLKRHLVDHAVLADQEGRTLGVKEDLAHPRFLERLITTPGVLSISEPASVLAARVHLQSEDARRMMGVYMLAAVDLPGRPSAERWALLHLRALMQGYKAVAEAWEPPKSSPWRCSWAQTRPLTPHLEIRIHMDYVCSVALGEVDGRAVIVSGSSGGSVRLWDAKDRTPIGDSKSADHTGRVNSVALGKVDGRAVIVSGSYDRTVRLWDAKDRTSIGMPIAGHKGRVNSVALGEVDGRAVIVSGSSDGTVQLWDAKDREVIGNLDSDDVSIYKDEFMSVALGEVDGRAVIVSGSSDGTVQLWDAKGRTTIGDSKSADHMGRVNSVAMGKVDGRAVIVSGGDDGTVRLWDAKDGTPIGEPLIGHKGSVNSVALGQVDGRAVIVSGGDMTVRLWDATDLMPICAPLAGHEDGVSSVAFGAVDGRAVIVSGGDSTARLWDAKDSYAISEKLTDREQEVKSFALGEVDGRAVIVSGGYDGTLQLRDAKDGTPIGVLPTVQKKGSLNSVALGEVDGRIIIVSGSSDGTVQLWDAKDRTAIGVLPTVQKGGSLNSVALGEVDGRIIIVSGSSDGTVQLWDAKDRMAIGVLPTVQKGGSLNSVALGEVDGRAVIVSGSSDGTVHMWDAKDRKLIREPLPPVHKSWVTSVALGEVDDRAVIVSGGYEGNVQLWNGKDGRPIGEPLTDHKDSINSVALGKVDGLAMFVSGDRSGTVCLWDLKTSALLSTLRLAQGVIALALGSDGHLAIATSRGLIMIELQH